MAFRWEERKKGDKTGLHEHRMLTPNGGLAATIRQSVGELKGFWVWTVYDLAGEFTGSGVCKTLEAAKTEVSAEVLRQGKHSDVRRIAQHDEVQVVYTTARRFLEVLPQYPELEFPRPMLPFLEAMRAACARWDSFPEEKR